MCRPTPRASLAEDLMPIRCCRSLKLVHSSSSSLLSESARAREQAAPLDINLAAQYQPSVTCTGSRSQKATPSDVAHDAQKAEQADDEGDAVDLPELPYVVGDGTWKNQVLSKNACARM